MKKNGSSENMRLQTEVYFEFVNDMQARKYEFATDEEVNKISEELIRKNHKAYLWFKSFNRFLIISLDVLICRYSPLFRAFPALFISEEPHKSFYYPLCFRSQK